MYETWCRPVVFPQVGVYTMDILHRKNPEGGHVLGKSSEWQKSDMKMSKYFCF